MKQEALRRSQPLMAYLELTYSCNLSCLFCYNARRFDRSRLSAQDWAAVLDDLRALGTLTITLTGGEPLAHPEFFQIARAARDRALAIRIFTNGTLIGDGEANEIASLHPQTVEVSLHGATSTTHDRATGRPGSFDAMWRGIERLRRHGIRLVVKTPLTCVNEHELEELISLVLSAGLPLHIDPSLTPRDDGDRSPLAYAPSRGAVLRLMNRQGVSHSLRPVQREAGAANCGLGRLTVAIDPEGNVYPCIQWRQTALGNVRTQRLATLWGESPARLEAAQTALDANAVMMKAGDALSAFPFCPAVAFQRSGDALAPDAVMIEHAGIAVDVRREMAR